MVDIKLYKKSKDEKSSKVITTGASSNQGGSSTSHTHANKNALDAITIDSEGYEYLTQQKEVVNDSIGVPTTQVVKEKVKAGYADKAGQADEADHADVADDLAEDSPANDRFLSKTKADRTPYLLSSDTGFEAGNFVSGASGAMLAIDKVTGQSFAEVDRLYVRMKAYFEQLTIINSASIGGRKHVTPGGSVRISEVEEMRDEDRTLTGWKCWYLSEQDGEKTDCFLIEGDQAICEFFNAKTGTSNGISNTYYWRKVTEVSNEGGVPPSKINDTDSDNRYGWFALSATDCENPETNDAPKADDVVTQLGYDGRDEANLDRQSAIVLSTVGADAPGIRLYSGIDGYSLDGKDMVGFGYNPATGKAYLNSYGDFRFGSRTDDGSYITFDETNREMLAKLKLTLESTIGGKTFEQYILDVSPKVTEEDIREFVTDIVGTDLEEIQKQIDGAIETWFANGEPTIDNYPAGEWNTEALRERHSGDLYYDNSTGAAWRFGKNGKGEWEWIIVTDEAISKALAAAKEANDRANDAYGLADGKAKIFYRQPLDEDEYDVGDLWVNATYPQNGSKYKNDILRANTAKSKGDIFDIAHWELASKYTDDALAQSALDKINGLEYLSEALGQSTDINGGLILSSLIWLRDGQGNVMSGINGTTPDGVRSIAAWYGGKMIDLESNPNVADAAKSLFRMDGSGYMAGGNISWGVDGSGSIAGGNISWNSLGAITIGQGVTFDIGNVNGLEGDLKSLQKSIESVEGSMKTISESILGFNNIFTLIDKNDQPRLFSDAAKIDIADIKALRINVGAYSVSFLSALELNDASGGGGIDQAWLDGKGYVTFDTIKAWVSQQNFSGQVDLSGYLTKTDAASLYQPKGTYITSLAGYATQSWVEGKNYLTSVAFSDLTAHPTTLGDYGITDAKIANGVITLGTATITPLVAADMKTLTFAAGKFSAKTYTPNSSAVTVNVPTTTKHLTEDTNLFFTNARAVSALKSVTDALAADIKANATAIANLEKMFEIVDSNVHVKGGMGLYSDSFISALGKNDEASSGSLSSGGVTAEWLGDNGFATLADTMSSVEAAYVRVDGQNGTAAGVSALMNKLTEGTSNPQDADYYISQYAGGGTTTTTYHRRKHSALWNYIKGKTDALYVTVDTEQTIGARKTYTEEQRFSNSAVSDFEDPIYGVACAIKAAAPIAATKFILRDGKSSEFLMADGSTAAIHNLSGTYNLGLTDTSDLKKLIPSLYTLAYWNGAYDNTNASHLLYCDRGRFGTIVTASSTDYVLAHKTTNSDIDSDWGQSVKTFDPAPSGSRPEDSNNITLLSLGNEFNRRKMLAFCYSNDNIYYRRRTDDFSPWVKLWNSGNDGHGSGLNADMLDGVHLAAIKSSGGVTRSWARGNYTTVNQYFGNGNIVTFDPAPTDSTELWSNTTVLSLGDAENRNTQLAFSYNSDTIKYRRKDNNDWQDWQIVAFESSNVESATRLKTKDEEYTAWGQPFFIDGKPRNLSGDMSNVGHILLGKEKYIYAVDDTGTRRTLFDFYPGQLPSFAYGFATAGYDVEYCGYNLKLAYGNSRTTGLILTSNGYIGVGKTNPSYRFDVNGAVRATSLVIGNCTITYENGGLHFSTGIYSDSFITAMGKNDDTSEGSTVDPSDYVKKSDVTDNSRTLNAGYGYIIATIGDKDITVTMPDFALKPYVDGLFDELKQRIEDLEDR